MAVDMVFVQNCGVARKPLTKRKLCLCWQGTGRQFKRLKTMTVGENSRRKVKMHLDSSITFSLYRIIRRRSEDQIRKKVQVKTFGAL